MESRHAYDVSRYVSVALHRCLLCLRRWGVKVGILVSRYLSVALHLCFRLLRGGEGLKTCDMSRYLSVTLISPDVILCG